MLYRGRSLYAINECQVIESFQGLLKDIEHITYASYLCELIHISMQDEESNGRLFVYLISAFYFMKSDAADIEVLARCFEVKLLEATGFSLNFDYCASCRKKIDSSDYISLQFGGGICTSCERVDGVKVSYAAFNALRFLTKMPLENICRVKLSQTVKVELYKILSIIISQNYFKKPKSLETLNYLRGVSENE